MLYTIERRCTFGYGVVESHYEVRKYTHRTPIGVLANGVTLKSGTKEQCVNYCRKCNIIIEK